VYRDKARVVSMVPYLAVERGVEVEERLEAAERRHVGLLLLLHLRPPLRLDLRLLHVHHANGESRGNENGE